MQDKTFAQIGKLVLKEMGNKEPYQLFIQNMFSEKANYKMIVGVFELKTVDEHLICSFKNIDPQNVSSQNFQKYAYRKGSARGGDITFTTKFGDIEKKLRTLVEQQLKGVVSRLSSSALTDEFNIFNAVYRFLRQKDNYEQVKQELAVFYEGLPKEDKTASGLSLMFIIDGEERYLSDFQIIQQILSASGTEEKSEKYGVKSEGLDGICSVCLQIKPKLHGFASPFKYATVDKPGTVSGFFRQENNWKNYPICTDCSLEFELGRTYVMNNLSSYFYKKAYYTIPKTILSNDTQNLQKAVGRLKELYTDFSKGQKIKFQEDGLQKMIAQEAKDYFNLNLLFYEENPTTKAIKIKLMLEEIVPSRFRTLFVDVPNKINNQALYKKAIYLDKTPVDLTFSFGILNLFFEDNFYECIQKVFMIQPISEDTLYIKFNRVISNYYNKGFSLYPVILKAHLTISYLQELNIIPKQYFNMEDNEIITKQIEKPLYKKYTFDADRINAFLKNQTHFFGTNSEARKGVFLVGAMVKILLEAQSDELNGSTPFEKKLKGYNINTNDLKTIYREAYGKLKVYKEKEFYYYPEKLMDFVDKYFNLNVEAIEKMSVNKVSFFFISGMQLINELKALKIENK